MISDSELINAEMIAELKDILADDFPMLVESFLEDANKRLMTLTAAVNNENAELIRTESHSLKGASLNLGVVKLPSLFSQLEACGKENKLDNTSELLAEIITEYPLVEAALKASIYNP